MKVVASPLEDRMITTDPKQLLKQEKEQKQEDEDAAEREASIK